MHRTQTKSYLSNEACDKKAKYTSFSNLDKTNNISHLIQPAKNYMYNPYQREWRSR